MLHASFVFLALALTSFCQTITGKKSCGQPCTHFTECEDVLICSKGICFDDPYLHTSVCSPAGPPTAAVQNACGEACANSYGCPDPLVCLQGHCTDNENATSRLCAPAPAPAPALNGCGGTCALKDDCQPPLSCINGMCTDHPGQGTNVCPPTQGCGESCASKDDCPHPLSCVNGRCEDDPWDDTHICSSSGGAPAPAPADSGGGGAPAPAPAASAAEQRGCGKSCQHEDDCPGRLTCKNQHCTDDPDQNTNICDGEGCGESCRHSSECLGDLICVDRHCADDSDQHTHICDSNDYSAPAPAPIPVPPTAPAPTASSDQASCGKQCEGSGECPGALVCINKRCADSAGQQTPICTSDGSGASPALPPAAAIPSSPEAAACGKTCKHKHQCPGKLTCKDRQCVDDPKENTRICTGTSAAPVGAAPAPVDTAPAPVRSIEGGEDEVKAACGKRCEHKTDCPGVLVCISDRCTDDEHIDTHICGTPVIASRGLGLCGHICHDPDDCAGQLTCSKDARCDDNPFMLTHICSIS